MKPLITSSSLALLLCAAPAAAQGREYQVPDHHSSRHLQIEGNRFSLNSAGFAGNLCQLEGRFRRQGREAVFDDGQGCRVRFSFARRSVQVAADENEACRQYCGHNAVMSGRYRALPAACTEEAMKRSEARFLAHYRAGRFAEAARIKQQRLNQCEDFMWFIQRLNERSDLALSHRNAGNRTACRLAMQPLADEIEESSDFQVPATWRSEYEDALKAARFNWAQCRPN